MKQLLHFNNVQMVFVGLVSYTQVTLCFLLLYKALHSKLEIKFLFKFESERLFCENKNAILHDNFDI
jgi:hypothetical protein